MPLKTWILKNPYYLSIEVRLNPDGSVTATFPALPQCAASGASCDDALLNMAKLMQRILEEPHGTHTERTA